MAAVSSVPRGTPAGTGLRKQFIRDVDAHGKHAACGRPDRHRPARRDGFGTSVFVQRRWDGSRLDDHRRRSAGTRTRSDLSTQPRLLQRHLSGATGGATVRTTSVVEGGQPPLRART